MKPSKKKKSDTAQLTENSRCTIHSLGDRNTMLVSSGIFRGYSRFGSGEAICMELDESHGDLGGEIRLIPSHVVLAVDLLEIVEDKEDEDDQQIDRYYG